MTTILGYGSTSAFPASDGRPANDMERQRDAWLHQLQMNELALLQSAGGKQSGAGARHDGPRSHARDASDAAARTAAALVLPVQVMKPAVGKAPAPDGVGAATGAVGAGTAAAGTDLPSAAGSRVPQADAAGGAVPTSAAGNPAGQLAAGGADLALAVRGRMQQLAGPSGGAGPGFDSQDLAGAAIPADGHDSTALAVALAAVSADSDSAAQPAAVLRAMPQPAALGAARLPDASPVSAATEGAEGMVAESSQDDGTPLQGDAWEKRLIHVAQDGAELSISIRDPSLNARQSAAVVYRLVGDAAESGLRVRNATVNGRTLFKLSRTVVRTATGAHPPVSTEEPINGA